MKKNIMCVLAAMFVLCSCSNDDEAGPASEQQIEMVSGHWYTEIPISGETDNWRTEEEGDRTAFDKVVAIFYLSDHTFMEGWWGYLYLQNDNEMINYGGLDLGKKESSFNYTMDSDGTIIPSSQLLDAPKIANMRYNSNSNVITTDVTYNGKTFALTFIRPTDESWVRLDEYFNILLEENIVGGYEDLGTEQHTDVTDEAASEPSRARALK